MEIITLNEDNLEREHICCAISDKKGETCVADKKAWLQARFPEGLVFKKVNVRGKAFIEYIPAENAWCPIDAAGYMHINCFWVAGQFKGLGYGKALLEACVADAKQKGMRGVTVLSAAKKLSYLSDPGFLKMKGFLSADKAAPYFELLYLPFTEDAPIPRFKPCCKEGKTYEPGMVVYYTHQCPFANKYVALMGETARRNGVALTLKRIDTTTAAQSAPTPFTGFGFFHNGAFVTHEIMSEKKFEAYLEATKS